jgi:hypothetical protein
MISPGTHIILTLALTTVQCKALLVESYSNDSSKAPSETVIE